jgi:putative NADH-flavin reductase
MNVLIFGASGKTGGLAARAALSKGHTATVLVRNPAKLDIPGAHILTGDATNPSDVLNAMQGQDAVIEAIGGTTPWKSTQLETTSVRNIISAMKTTGARRLIVVSMMGIGESRAQAPFWYKYLLMPTFLHGSTPDKTNMEAEVKASGLDYIIMRPPILKDGPATGNIRVIGTGETGHTITRADLADFMVDQLQSNQYLGSAITVVNS